MKPTTVLKPTRPDVGKCTMNNSNSADLLSHPVALELSKQLEQSCSRRLELSKQLGRSYSPNYGWTAAKAVLKVGRTFIGIARPKGYRQMKQKQCFGNAAKLALHNRGIYVEGFVLTPGSWPIHHAWLTLDEVHAIDVTLKDAPACHYLGIPFSHEVLCEWYIRRGCRSSLLHGDEEKTHALLEYARLHPPSFNDTEPQ